MDAIAAANELKLKGNAQYKARNFTEAIALYEQAWDTNKDITFLNNLSGSFYCLSRALRPTADKIRSQRSTLSKRNTRKRSKPQSERSKKVEKLEPTTSSSQSTHSLPVALN